MLEDPLEETLMLYDLQELGYVVLQGPSACGKTTLLDLMHQELLKFPSLYSVVRMTGLGLPYTFTWQECVTNACNGRNTHKLKSDGDETGRFALGNPPVWQFIH